MKSRADLNAGLDTLSATSLTLENAYSSLTNDLNLSKGGLIALSYTSGTKGADVDVPINYVKGHSLTSGMQFDFTVPPGLAFLTATLGPAGTGKQIAFNAIPTGVRVLIFGVNQTVLESGLLAILHFNISSTASSGNSSIGVGGVVASNASGNALPLSALTGTVNIQ